MPLDSQRATNCLIVHIKVQIGFQHSSTQTASHCHTRTHGTPVTQTHSVSATQAALSVFGGSRRPRPAPAHTHTPFLTACGLPIFDILQRGPGRARARPPHNVLSENSDDVLAKGNLSEISCTPPAFVDRPDNT